MNKEWTFVISGEFSLIWDLEVELSVAEPAQVQKQQLDSWPDF